MQNLTAIIPIDLSQRSSDIIPKAVRLAEAAQLVGTKIIFGHNDLSTVADKKFKASIRKYSNAKIASQTLQSEAINMSAMRNVAFKHVDTDYTLLLDVDIWPAFDLIQKYLKKIEEGQQPFYMLPCLYLTRVGTSELVKSKIDTISLQEKFFGFSRKEFLHLASPSSVTILKTCDYRDLEGFDENFTGHGYEDFDFLMRLASKYELIPAAPDVLTDRVARSPLFAVGFRRYLGETCLDALLDKDFVFHLYHEKPKQSPYYAARPSNYALFRERHLHRVGVVAPDDSTLISAFSKLCHEKQIDIHNLSILYDNKPGHIDRFDTFRRRLRFLLND